MKTLLSGVTTHPCRGRRNHSRDSASSEPTIQCSTSQASSHETTVTTEILAVGRTLRKAPAWRILSVHLTACLYQAGMVSKRLNVSAKFFRCHRFSFISKYWVII